MAEACARVSELSRKDEPIIVAGSESATKETVALVDDLYQSREWLQ